MQDLPESHIPERRGVFAFMSSIEREGIWVVPRAFRGLAVLGNIELDLTHADLGAYTEMELRCFLGSIEIIVPPDVRLECDGDATIGNFEIIRKAQSTMSPDAPRLHIKAGVFLGNIEVTVRDPNAPGLLQRLKSRWKLRDTDPN